MEKGRTLFDISQEVFSCNVYPGDPAPEMIPRTRISDGAVCNLTAFSMCAHNGTHVDAPFHFLQDGTTIDRIPLDHFTGDCFLVRHEGDVSGDDAKEILRRAEAAEAAQRILIAGKATVTEEAPMQVHLILLGAEVVLLEGIVLKDIPEGKYFLNAAPLQLGGIDGAPCRAWLMA